jgi:hypothetical protein
MNGPKYLNDPKNMDHPVNIKSCDASLETNISPKDMFCGARFEDHEGNILFKALIY